MLRVIWAKHEHLFYTEVNEQILASQLQNLFTVSKTISWEWDWFSLTRRFVCLAVHGSNISKENFSVLISAQSPPTYCVSVNKFSPTDCVQINTPGFVARFSFLADSVLIWCWKTSVATTCARNSIFLFSCFHQCHVIK